MFNIFNKISYRKMIFNFSVILFITSLSLCEASSNLNNNLNKDNVQNKNNNPIIIGILIPLEHTALREIVSGFKETVAKQYPQAIFDVQNAQGDIKLQRSILELFVGKKENLIVPVGTTATQMALSYVKQQPIVSLAADYTEEDRQKRKSLNITGVLDEIGGIKKLDLIKQMYPDIKKITLVFHNGNEKNFKEINQIEQYGKEIGIQLQKLGINGLPELETVSTAINQDSEAVLILKDHLIASGIKLLLSPVQKRGIPLIASDEGSVQEGAAFALGVKERTIGEAGGKLAIKVLQGENIADLPIVQIQTLAIFYNKAAALKQKVEVSKLQEVAEKNDYALVPIE